MTKQKNKETWRDVYQTDHITSADFDQDADTTVILVKAWKEEVTGEGGSVGVEVTNAPWTSKEL
jgi:hypothetical protein